MSNALVIVLLIVGGIVCYILYSIVSYIGDKVVDKADDAINNATRRKKNSENEGKTENLADRYKN